MTLKDLYRVNKLSEEDLDKVVIFEDIDGGWTNVDAEIRDCIIVFKPSKNSPFKDE